MMSFFTVGSYIMDMDFDFFRLDSTFNNTFLKIGVKNVRENREDIEAHRGFGSVLAYLFGPF